jgi:hypothetical protein
VPSDQGTIVAFFFPSLMSRLKSPKPSLLMYCSLSPDMRVCSAEVRTLATSNCWLGSVGQFAASSQAACGNSRPGSSRARQRCRGSLAG